MPKILVRWLAIATGELVREHLGPDAVDAKRIVAASQRSVHNDTHAQDTTRGGAAPRVRA